MHQKSIPFLALLIVGLLAGRGIASPLYASPGDVFVAPIEAGRILRVESDGSLTAIYDGGAGSRVHHIEFGPDGYLWAMSSGNLLRIGDGGVATVERTFSGLAVEGFTWDDSGNLYVGEHSSSSILRVTPDGTTTTFATGVLKPRSLAFGSDGRLYVASNQPFPGRLYAVDAGVGSLVASGGLQYEYVKQGVDGKMYFTRYEFSNPTPYMGSYDPTTGVTNLNVFSGTNRVTGLDIDSQGFFYVAHMSIGGTDTNWIYKVSPDGSRELLTDQIPFNPGTPVGDNVVDVAVAPQIPEPGTLALVGVGLIGIVRRVRRGKEKGEVT